MNKFWPKHSSLLWLLILYFILHLPVFVLQTISFTFDQGKDALAVMHLVETLSPALIGSWTSIPGVYYGAGWYYLLSPFYLLFGAHPLFGAAAMTILGAFQVGLVYWFFGALAALFVTATPLWLMMTSGAWIPYPITLAVWGIIILLDNFSSQKRTRQWQWLLLGGLMGLSFHFAASVALLYPILFAGSLWLRKIRLNWSKASSLLAGFILPFIPQIVFEWRHDFLQTRGVLTYLSGGVEIETSLKPSLSAVLSMALGELQLAIFPDFSVLWQTKTIGTILFLLLLATAARFSWLRRTHRLSKRFLEWLMWFSVTVIWLTLTHYNAWYLFGLAPFLVLVAKEMLLRLSLRGRGIVIVIVVLLALIRLWSGVFWEQQPFTNRRAFLPVELKTIQRIYELVNERPFAVFTYVPHIYDFEWQYLYFWQAKSGKQLPTEFAYEPKVPEYVSQKPALLQKFSSQQPRETAQLIFYVVEKPYQQFLLESWWQRQKYDTILQTEIISDEVTLYVAKPVESLDVSNP